jgi:hypothetical protein
MRVSHVDKSHPKNQHGLSIAFNTPRQIRQEALAKIKSELVRLGTNGSRTGFTFARKMFERYPELRTL